MSWLLLFPLIYATVILLVGDPATSPSENEMANHPTRDYAYGKSAPSHTRLSWRVHVALLLATGGGFLALRGGVSGFFGWAVVVAMAVALARVLYVAVKRPFGPELEAPS